MKEGNEYEDWGFQFCCSDDISKNHQSIINAIDEASKNNVRLLVFHECATCGYPPVETPDIRKIDFDSLKSNLREVNKKKAIQ